MMERRFEVRKQELLAECKVEPKVFEDMMERLRDFAQPFVDCLWRCEQKQHAQTYLAGLLSDLERKNVESIAYRHDQECLPLQRFVGVSGWNHQPLLAELADYEVRTWNGWHHHQTLSLIATWFLVQETRWGKKIHPGDHGAANPQGTREAAA